MARGQRTRKPGAASVALTGDTQVIPAGVLGRLWSITVISPGTAAGTGAFCHGTTGIVGGAPVLWYMTVSATAGTSNSVHFPNGIEVRDGLYYDEFTNNCITCIEYSIP